MKNLVGRYLLFVTGLYFLAAGIVLILRSSLGTTPISSVNYVLSLNSALTLGTWTFVINMLLIAGQFWFIRDRMTRRDTVEILLQMPFSLLFGLFIDFNMVRRNICCRRTTQRRSYCCWPAVSCSRSASYWRSNPAWS